MNYEEIYANDILVCQGGEVKRLENRRIGGYLVKFSTAKDPDLAGDYFDKNTDFDIEDGERRSLYYNHGLDEKIGNQKIGLFTVQHQDMGLWMEGVISERSEFGDAVLTLVDKGQLSYSSGSVSHLVRREPVSKNSPISYVKSWPIAEGSMTPTPCEPRLLAIPLKSLFIQPQEETPAAETIVKAAVSISTPRELEAALRDAGYSVHESKVLVSKFSLRDVESAPEDISDTFRGDALRELARTELQNLRLAGVAF